MICGIQEIDGNKLQLILSWLLCLSRGGEEIHLQMAGFALQVQRRVQENEEMRITFRKGLTELIHSHSIAWEVVFDRIRDMVRDKQN